MYIYYTYLNLLSLDCTVDKCILSIVIPIVLGAGYLQATRCAASVLTPLNIVPAVKYECAQKCSQLTSVSALGESRSLRLLT